jgi:flagellar hook-associated protein 3 FlgL
MRITQNMLNHNMLYNLQANTERLSQYQTQLSSGKKINTPSDDPVGTGLIMQYNNQLAQNQQYQSNVSYAQGWLDYTDTLLGQVTSVMQRARELAVQGANGTNSPDAQNAIAAEIDQLEQQLVQTANSVYNGKYVFNGQMVDQAPYDPNNPTSRDPNTMNIEYEVGDGITIPVNTSGVAIFGKSTDADNAFAILQNLSAALKSGNQTAIQNSIGLIDSRMTQIQSARSDVGARQNRLELISNRLKDEETNLQSLLSDTQDANIAEVITNLKTAENVQQASLAAGARILIPTLVDFLK